LTTEPRTLALCRSYDGLVTALRARQDELGLSNNFVDEVGGLTSGHCDKLLGPARTKSLGGFTIDVFLELLGVSLILVEDMAKVEKMAHRWERRQQRYVVPIDHPSRHRVNRAIRENGRLGGLKRAASLSPKRRSEIARKGAIAANKRRRKNAKRNRFYRTH
jgi:hypothetical protein